jgi:hypothetical protein
MLIVNRFFGELIHDLSFLQELNPNALQIGQMQNKLVRIKIDARSKAIKPIV